MRVQFTIDLSIWNAQAKAFREIYGDSLYNSMRGNVTRVDSTPEDFVRFLHQRNLLGAQNLWKDLNVVIVDQEDDDVKPEIGLSRQEAAVLGGMCFLYSEFEDLGNRLLKSVKDGQ